MPWLQILLRAAAYFAASVTVDQTFGISTALTQYFGPFPSYDYAARYTPSSSEPVPVIVPVNLKDAYDMYPTTVLESQVHDIDSLNQTESYYGVLASEMVNIFGVPHEIQLTANASDVREFARNVSMADSESTKAACLVPSHRWSWLYNMMGHDPLNKLFRAFVMFLLCHDYVMNRAYVVFPTMTLVGGAMFYGWHFRVKTLREIVRMSKKLSTAEDFTVNLMNNVTSAEARALEAEETKGQLQQQYSEAVILKDTSKWEADAARGEADTARKAASAALALANDENNRLNVVSNTQEATLDEFRQENSELRGQNLALRNEVDRINIASTTAVERSQKKSMQEIDSLKQAKKDKDEKLKSQNQTTIKLRDDVKSLKDQLKDLSPDGVEKLKKQLLAEEEARTAAEKTTRDLEAEISKVEKERKTWAGEVGELKKKMEEGQEGRRAAEEKAAEMEAQKKKTEEAKETQMSSDASTIEKLKNDAEEAMRDRKAAEGVAAQLQAQKNEGEAIAREQASADADIIAKLRKEVETAVVRGADPERQMTTLRAELESVREEAAAARAAKNALEDRLEEERVNAEVIKNEYSRTISELQTQLASASDMIREQDGQIIAMLERTQSQIAEKDAAIEDLQSRLSARASWPVSEDDAGPDFSSTGVQPDEPQPRPAVRLPSPGSSILTPNEIDADEDAAGFSIKGAAGRRVNAGSDDGEAGNDHSNGSSRLANGSKGEDIVYAGQDVPPLQPPHVAKTCFCDNCGRKHAPPCKYMGPPYCANCGHNHMGKLNNCKKWCRQCQASHYKSDCPHFRATPHDPSRTPNASNPVGVSNDLKNPQATNPAPPAAQGNQPTPVPAKDASGIPRPQQGGYGAHRYTAPGQRPHRPSPGGFVPVPAAERHGPANGRGKGRGWPGHQHAPPSAADSFQRQQKEREN